MMVQSFRYDSVGRRLLTTSEKTAILWDATTRQRLREFRGEIGAVRPVAFSPDGGHVLTSGMPGPVRRSGYCGAIATVLCRPCIARTADTC
jgi:WD40 repeat protein